MCHNSSLNWFNLSLQPCLSVWLKNPLLSCFLSPVHTASFWSKGFFFLQQIWWSKPLGCLTAECVFHYFNLSHDSVLVFHNCKGILWRGSSTCAVTKSILLKTSPLCKCFSSYKSDAFLMWVLQVSYIFLIS